MGKSFLPLKNNSYAKGLLAEKLAGLYFLFKGFRIVERRYKTKLGEVDLIVKNKNTLIFVEVKMRGRMEDALHSISLQAQNRIARAAQLFVAENTGLAHMSMRFDVFCVVFQRSFLPFRFVHLDNAWLVQA